MSESLWKPCYGELPCKNNENLVLNRSYKGRVPFFCCDIRNTAKEFHLIEKIAFNVLMCIKNIADYYISSQGNKYSINILRIYIEILRSLLLKYFIVIP